MAWAFRKNQSHDVRGAYFKPIFACGSKVLISLSVPFFALAEREKRNTEKSKYRYAEGYDGVRYGTAQAVSNKRFCHEGELAIRRETELAVEVDQVGPVDHAAAHAAAAQVAQAGVEHRGAVALAAAALADADRA